MPLGDCSALHGVNPSFFLKSCADIRLDANIAYTVFDDVDIYINISTTKFNICPDFYLLSTVCFYSKLLSEHFCLQPFSPKYSVSLLFA